MAAAKTVGLKKKKKKWLPILASKEFNLVELGETYIDENEKVLGKVISANLMNITRDPKKQNIQLYFVVRDIRNNEAHTELLGYEMVNAYLRRVTKKAKERIDHSFLCTSQDNVKFRIKPVVMTKGVAHKSVGTTLRANLEEYLTAFSKKTPLSEIMKSVVAGNLQKDIKNELKKVYPLASCMIKSMEKLSK